MNNVTMSTVAWELQKWSFDRFGLIQYSSYWLIATVEHYLTSTSLCGLESISHVAVFSLHTSTKVVLPVVYCILGYIIVKYYIICK